MGNATITLSLVATTHLPPPNLAAALDDGSRRTADASLATRADVSSSCVRRCVSVLAAALRSAALDVGLRNTSDARLAARLPVSLDMDQPSGDWKRLEALAQERKAAGTGGIEREM